ncbi:MAG TPA: tRNA lysidine(34) synthetase TilS [Solirubrobacterales bacterium]|jgi:tRNA(Ile)-lysidine synthase|nr:tRNA lysidine(34) synthetase TilS [Solirubrobacterales bacterium]
MKAKAEALGSLARVVRESGLVSDRSSGVVLVSGGPDSGCLAAGLAEHCGRPNVHALHLNYGLRGSAADDEQICRRLCASLRIDLRVERPRLEEGNMQAAAREARHVAAERLRERLGCDWVATGHTRTDVAETVLYRLAASPGRRALLGLPARRGRLVRPLLSIERSDTRRLATAARLPFADDPTNLDRSFARNRIRHEVLPALREVNPAAERNLAETRAELAEEARVLERVVAETLEAAGAGSGAIAIRADALEGAEPGLRRLALRTLAERIAGREVPLGRRSASEMWRLAHHPEGGEVDLGGGLRAVCEQGLIRFSEADEAAPEPVTLAVPGRCRFGRWEVRAELRHPPVPVNGPERAILDPAALGTDVVVRTWREGDRIRPLGMHGTKSLQDLFTDRRVPRSLRHRLPVVTAGERVAWVAGVAVSEEFRLSHANGDVVVLSANLHDAD